MLEKFLWSLLSGPLIQLSRLVYCIVFILIGQNLFFGTIFILAIVVLIAACIYNIRREGGY